AASATRAPESVAFRREGQELSYRALCGAARALAHQLRAQGVGRGHLVGVCTGRELEFAIAVLGVLEAGAAYVPLDPEYPIDRLKYIVDDAGVRLVIAGPATADQASRLGRTVLQASREESSEPLPLAVV